MTAPLIPSRTRAVMRRIRERTFVDAIAVQLPTSSEVDGGTSTTYATAVTLAGRVEAPGTAERERFAAGQLRAEPTCVVAVPAGSELNINARLIATGSVDTGVGAAAWTRTLEILGDSGPTSVTVERKYPCRDVA